MLTLKPNNTVLATNTIIANNFWIRFKGLSYIKEIPTDTVIIFPNCQIIHMFFMHFPLGLIFLNNQKDVVNIVKKIDPWKISPLIKEAYYIIEGSPEITRNLKIGDCLDW